MRSGLVWIAGTLLLGFIHIGNLRHKHSSEPFDELLSVKFLFTLLGCFQDMQNLCNMTGRSLLTGMRKNNCILRYFRAQQLCFLEFLLPLENIKFIANSGNVHLSFKYEQRRSVFFISHLNTIPLSPLQQSKLCTLSYQKQTENSSF